MLKKAQQSAKKAAIILSALGEDIAAQILKRLGPKDSIPILKELARLGKVEPSEIESVQIELQKIIKSFDREMTHDFSDTFKNLLKKRTNHTFIEFPDPNDASQNLRNTLEQFEIDDLSRILCFEHLQTVAVIVSHIEEQKSAYLLKKFAKNDQTEIISRIANLKVVDPEIIDDIRESLQSALESSQAGPRKKLGGIQSVAKIISSFDKETSEKILGEIEEKKSDIAAKIKAEMFTFDDLGTIDDAGIRNLITDTPRKTLLLALHGVNNQLLEKFLKNLSERAQKTLLEDLKSQSSIRSKDMVNARADMILRSQRLEKEGKLIIINSKEKLV